MGSLFQSKFIRSSSPPGRFERVRSVSGRSARRFFFFDSFAMNCKCTRAASALIALFLDVESAHDTFSNNFQVHFAVVDLELHTNYVPGGSETIYDVDQKVGKRTQIIPPLPEDRFLCSFSHIFAGSSSSLSSSSFSLFLTVNSFFLCGRRVCCVGVKRLPLCQKL